MASKFDSKQQAAKELEIRQMVALPEDLERCYEALLADENSAPTIELNCFRARYLWAMWTVSRNSESFWSHLAQATSSGTPCEEDW